MTIKHLDLFREIVVDNFAGGGGASTGIELATGVSVDIAINHDPEAIAMHRANHPETEHYCESVWDVDPVKAVKGRKVGLAWFSPDCKHFSKAKGGKPVEKKIRGLAWIAVRWAIAVKPRVIILENVEEFQTWGPLDKDGFPDPNAKGKIFESFVKALESLGYTVEFKQLRASDYGAPTIRKRLFMIARCDGKQIVWPEPTHGDPKQLKVTANRLKPWRTASEIIDWSLPTPSIFDRKKPLSDNTLRRIARGIDRFVLNDPKPFIVRIGQTGFGGDRLQYSLEQPLTTVTTKAEHCLVYPTLIQMGYGDPEGKRVLDLHKPLGTITAGGNKFGLATAVLSKQSLITPTLLVNTTGHPGSKLDEPVRTITTGGHHALITAFISRQFGTSTGHRMEQPLGTVTAVDKSRLVTAFLTKFYGSDTGQSLDSPLHTVTTKDRFGLVTIEGQDYQILDIGMRMLQPHELFAAQGFPTNYIIDKDFEGNKYSKAKQVARCGNAVPPPFANALVRANLSEMCVKPYKYQSAEKRAN